MHVGVSEDCNAGLHLTGENRSCRFSLRKEPISVLTTTNTATLAEYCGVLKMISIYHEFGGRMVAIFEDIISELEVLDFCQHSSCSWVNYFCNIIVVIKLK